MNRPVFLFVLLLASAADAFTLASKSTCATIVVGASEPACVWLAARDLKSDVFKITGRELALVRGSAPKAGDVFIATKASPAWESYAVSAADGVLRIAGSDARGTMFGVYDFIERYLGVDPMYFWSDVPYPQRPELAWDAVTIDQPPPTFRFRGWFLNDEDLLTRWRDASGVRDYSTYPYYNAVVNHGVMEAVAEALVRARMNMIIPASFLNVLRPAEEGLAAICAKRGVFVTQHHIEPMGLSGYAFRDYWQKKGRTLEYSYFKYPREVEEAWRATAAKWAKFPNVVWQIGLRGTGDRPMWNDDPTMPKDDAGRAKLISAALARQVAILDELGVPKEGRLLTTTLWGEGAYFCERGLLEIPKGTTIVFSDNNCGWRWQKDLLEGVRRPDCDYGVYYHHQLIGMGPHLASLVPAAKTAEMLRTARAKGAGSYAIFNVGNVREFVYNLDATSKMTWNLDAFDAAVWTRAWLGRRVPSAASDWLRVLNVYHRSLQVNPSTGVPCFLDGLIRQRFRGNLATIAGIAKGRKRAKVADEPAAVVPTAPPPKDPFHAALLDTKPVVSAPSDLYARLAAQRASYEQALRYAGRALEKTDERELRFARDFIVYPALVMHGMTEACQQGVLAEEAMLAGDGAAARESLERAKSVWQDLVAAGEEYCRGPKWENWYRGCEKVSPRLLLRQTLETLELLGEGE